MINLQQSARVLLRAIGDPAMILGASFDLSAVFCRGLCAEGAMAGYIANRPPPPDEDDPLIAGWWIDRAVGLPAFRRIRGGGATLVLFGYPDHHVFPGRLLLQARINGVLRIVMGQYDGAVLQDFDVAEMLLARITEADRNLAISHPSYDDAVDLVMAHLGDRFRLRPDEIAGGRVVHVMGTLGPGGAERQAAYTAAGLLRRTGREQVVLSSFSEARDHFYRPFLENAGVRVVEMPDADAIFEQPDIRELRNALQPHDHLGLQQLFQVIYCYAVALHALRPAVVHTWLDYPNVLAGLAAEAVGVPTQIAGCRSVAPDKFPMLFDPYMPVGYKALLRRRSTKLTLVNNSEAGARDYADWLGLPRSAMEVIRNGFDFPDQDLRAAGARIRQDLGFAPKDFVIGGIFRFSEEKRPELFVDVIAILAKRHPSLRAVAYGEGPMLGAMRAYAASLGLSDVIRLPGLTDDAWKVLAAMDAFLLTSRMEGLPNVLVEAQASGLPVVCTAVGGMRETFVEGETGFGVETATAKDLADCLDRLVTDPVLLRNTSAAARSFARRTFSREGMVDRTMALYDRVARESDPV